MKIVCAGDISNKKLNKISALIDNVFHVKILPVIEYHFMVLSNADLIGYCAVTYREIALDNQTAYLSLLGLLAIEKSQRGKGIGSELVRHVIKVMREKDSNGIILNCSESTVPFYTKLGFKVISQKAVYLRDSQRVIDNDPVLVMTFNDNLKLDDEYNKVYIGSDF